ncbi:hypothetical protein DP185_00155 [Enterobacter hormaechei]|nr:hypothetical protein DP185_00155 [Enterobacter hormaechei]
MFSKVAILAARERRLREEAHTDENAYIRFVNDCDLDRYLDVLRNDVPDVRAVSWRHAHSSGPWRK